MKTLRELLYIVDVNNILESLLLELTIDPPKLIGKLKSIAELARRAGTEGERAASLEALRRMSDRADDLAKQMVDNDPNLQDEADQFLHQVKSIIAYGNEKPEEKKPEPAAPMFKERQWVVIISSKKVGKVTKVVVDKGVNKYWLTIPATNETTFVLENDLRAATQDDVDAALATRATANKNNPKPDDSDDSSSGFNLKDWVFVKPLGLVGRVFYINPKRTAYQIIFSAGNRKTFLLSDLRKATAEEIKSQVGGRQQNSNSTNNNSKQAPQYNEGDWVVVKADGQYKGLVGKVLGKVAGTPFYTLWFPAFDTNSNFNPAAFRPATQAEVDNATKSKSKPSDDEWQIVKLANMNTGTSDKIYGIAQRGSSLFNFYGRRTGPSFKIINSDDPYGTFRAKIAKGYIETNNPISLSRALRILKNSV
jgi:hypothetical protein